jgi:opacity protein-like surface antigen
MKRILTATLLSAVIATPAFAAPASADSGVYGGITVGTSKTDNPYTTIPVTTKDTATVGGVLLGYQYTKNWGVEGFFTGAGKLAAQNAAGTLTGTGSSDAFGVNVVGTAPLNDSFSLYGKLGFASTRTSASSSNAAIAGRTLSGITGGLGGQFTVNKSVSIRLGVDTYELATIGGNVANAEDKFRSNVWSVGAIFKF